MSSDVDLKTLPRGSRGWTDWVHRLTGVDDLAESDWLELKSEVDFRKSGAAKIAKFILGAANRMPDDAARNAEGYAILVLGVSKGAAGGVPRIEDKDLELLLTRFLGVSGPHWETQRVPVNTERDVLVIIVDPPHAGDPMFLSRQNGDGISDGDLIVRAKGATRRATSEEFDRLEERARAAPSKVDLDVTVDGPVRAYVCDPSAMTEFVVREVALLLHDPPSPAPGPSAERAGSGSVGKWSTLPASQRASFLGIVSALTVPDGRSVADFREEVSRYGQDCDAALGSLISGIVAHHVKPVTFRISNHTDTFLRDVEVVVLLQGPVEQVRARPPEQFRAVDFLPTRPRQRGPQMKDLVGGSLAMPTYLPHIDVSSLHVPGRPHSSYSNSGSVTATFTIPMLRTRGTHIFDNEVVLVVRDPALHSIEGSWSATASGIDGVFTGPLSVQVREAKDLTPLVREVLPPAPATATATGTGSR